MMFWRQKLIQARLAPQAWLWRYFAILASLILCGLLVLAPYCAFWLHASGDAAVERAVAAQASGQFAIFGSGLSQDFMDYKLRLYAAVKPEIIALGSSRAMQFRGAWFAAPFVNMGGVAGNLAELRFAIDSMLTIAPPKAVLLAIDFWWFMPQWEEKPENRLAPTGGSYNYSLTSLKKPLEWLCDGKIGLREFFAPLLGIFGHGFKVGRYGIMAQQTGDGFGPEGAWNYTSEITGQKSAFDYQFNDTLQNIRLGLRAFYHARPEQPGPAQTHVDIFAEICCKLTSRGVRIFAFMPPLSATALAAMPEKAYPHLYQLKAALLARGLNLLDLTDPRLLNSDDCEFVDGFHGGEVVYARILRAMADHWPALLAYVNMEKIDALIRDWRGHAAVPDARITNLPETDFLGLGCQKRARSAGINP